MSRYELKIELLSDLCVSDGGVYNSLLDTDICYDHHGFPYIPARRIKGCLRECAGELNDWGMNIPVERLFGAKGSDSGRAGVRVGNAVLEGYGEMEAEAERHADNPVFHPQNVLNHFSYVRTQTSLDCDTGVADPTTLRTMRVADKGLVFVSEIEMDDADFDVMATCCDTFTNMGIARTRGLGEIRASLAKAGDIAQTERSEAKSMPDHAAYVPGADRLDYELFLEEPMIIKSTNGGEAHTLDYIEGSKILGILAQEIKRQGGDVPTFLKDGKLVCSNAYLSKGGMRCLEVPANYYSVKNDSTQYLEKRDPYQLPSELEGKQINMMKHCYAVPDGDGRLVREDVKIEERYHHRRPEDKSIGRAAKEASGDSRFYQISAIEAGQTFSGYITGTPEQIEKANECLSPLHTVYLGYSHSSEYGKAVFAITGTGTVAADKTVKASSFAVKLEAPALVYNDKAFYSTNADDLDAEIRATLGLCGDVVDHIDRYVNYTTVGGYNVTWNARKPMVEAFDKGTVLHYHLKRAVAQNVPGQLAIGERITEGYGEASVMVFADGEGQTSQLREIATTKADGAEDEVQIQPDSLANALCVDLFRDYVRMKAVTEVKNLSDGGVLKSTKARPTVSNMLLMCKECSSLDQIRKVVEDRYGEKFGSKAEKLKIAEDILKKVENLSATLVEGFCRKYRVTGYTCDKDACEHACLEAFLEQLKYVIRKNDGKEQGKEEA